MYVCNCNAISDDDLKRNPSLIYVCGTRCGRCKPDLPRVCRELNLQLNRQTRASKKDKEQ
jgi:bacterioferritin-associated ferredoxin